MVRERQKQRRGKFLLTMKMFGKSLYLYEAGTTNMGMPEEQSYVNWTRFTNEAQGFETVKAARAMIERLSIYDPVHDYKGAVTVCLRKGR